MQVIRELFGVTSGCEHVPETVPAAQATECQQCGSRFNIRLCATCGHVGCCDSQAGHARVHATQAGHPVIYGTPNGGGFLWCYRDNRYL